MKEPTGSNPLSDLCNTEVDAHGLRARLRLEAAYSKTDHSHLGLPIMLFDTLAHLEANLKAALSDLEATKERRSLAQQTLVAKGGAADLYLRDCDAGPRVGQ